MLVCIIDYNLLLDSLDYRGARPHFPGNILEAQTTYDYSQTR
jgi:hypothetical protein